MSVAHSATRAPRRFTGFAWRQTALAGACAAFLAPVALMCGSDDALAQGYTGGWSNTSGQAPAAVVPYYPPAPATWTSAAPAPAQRQQATPDVRPWMLAHRISNGQVPQQQATPQVVQPYYGNAPVLVAPPSGTGVREWPAQAPARVPVAAAPIAPTRMTPPITIQQTAQVGSRTPGTVPAPMLKEGQGIGAGPYWARGIGMYVTGWLNGAIPTINEITNQSSGTISSGTLADDSANDGVIFAPGIAVGVSLQRYGFPVRAELEYTSRSKIEYGNDPVFTNFASGTFDSVTKNQTLMVNTYLDLHRPGKSIQPYVGFGLGASWNKSDSTLVISGNTQRFSNNENEFAWSLIAGFGYRFADAWLIDTRYRWTNYGAARFGPVADPTSTDNLDIQARDISAHELGIGLRYHF